MLRYVVAFAVALLLIGLGALYVWSTSQMLRQKRESLLMQATASGDAEPTGIDQGEDGEFGMEMTPIEMDRILLADLLTRYSPILIVLILGIAWAVAARMQPSSSPHQ